MKQILLTNKHGECVEIVVTDDNKFVCPICGYISDSDDFHLEHRNNILVILDSDWEICPSCLTNYGIADAPSKAQNLGDSISKRWEWLRLEWLRKTSWSTESLKQLRDNLGVQIEPPESQD
jgi:RNA polymerase subunit RPABC4/transcription elongation factor Spt4